MSISLIYSGPHDEVEVPDAPGVVAQRDVPVDVPEEVAKRLTEQSTWTRAETKKAREARGQAEREQAEEDSAAETAAADARLKVRKARETKGRR